MIAHVVRSDFGMRGWLSYHLLVLVKRMGHDSGAWVLFLVQTGMGLIQFWGNIGGQIMNNCTSGALSIAHV